MTAKLPEIPPDFLTNRTARRSYISTFMDACEADRQARIARGVCSQCDEPLALGEEWCQVHLDEIERSALIEEQEMERMEAEGVDLDDDDAVFAWYEKNGIKDDT